MDFDLSRPISQLAESSERTHFVCIPSYNFSRPVSPFVLSISSDFYRAYLERHNSQYTVSLCRHRQTEHTSKQFCLPATFISLDVDFLSDFLERTPQAVFVPRLFLSVIRLWDYLLFPTNVVFDLIQMYIPRHMRLRSPFTEDLLALLRNSSHAVLAQSFAAIYFSGSRILFLVMYSYLHTPH